MVEICSHKKEDFPEFVDVWNKEHACLTFGALFGDGRTDV
jgi:hypothetical protein